MSLYEEYNKSKKATTQGGLYSEFTKSKEPKTSTFSTIKNVGKEIAKGLIKLPLRAATNIDQGLSGTNREIYSDGLRGGGGEKILDLGRITPIGTQTFDKGFTKQNIKKDLLDIGGSAVEAASYFPFAGAVKGGYTAGKLLANGSKEAAKQTLKGMAVEGFVGGAAQSLGQQTQQYAQDGTPISVTDVGKSAVGGAVVAPVLGILGRGIGKIFNRGDVPASIAVADEILPQAEIPRTKTSMAEYSRSQGYEPYTNPNELPSIQMGSTKSPNDIPTIQLGGKNKPKVANYEELRYEPIPDQSVRSQMPDTISSIIRDGKKAPELAEQAVKESSPAPKPVDTVSVDKAAKMLDTPDATDFQRQTNKLQVEQIMQKDQSEIIDIALGNKVPTDGLPAEAHYAVAANLADEMAKNGDSSLALKLSESTVRSKSGQGLQSLNITSKDNIVPILNDIRNKKEAKLSILSKKAKQKEIDTAIKGIQDEFSKVKGLPGTREQIINAINKLIC